MINELNKQAVTTFLEICKKEIKKGNCFFINRYINVNGSNINSKQLLLNIGIMQEKQIWNYILNLEEKDLDKIDFEYDIKRDTNSEIFVFKKYINYKLIYIKLTMRERGIICLSFHESY